MSPGRPRFAFDRPLLVLDVVGLREADLPLAPRIQALGDAGRVGRIRPALPAVTCTVQASMLTGKPPSVHGIVGNGWYHRDLAEVRFWPQSNALVRAPELYDLALEARSDFRCAKLFWWFNMYSSASLSVTPRPQYFANGLKLPGLYGRPSTLPTELQRELGAFPLFNFWGPGADIRSTRWIADAALRVLESDRPDLALVYLPHLDYDHQRFGPDDERSRSAVAAVDAEAGRLIDKGLELGMEVCVCSEYGIEGVEKPVFLNRLLRERGYLDVQETAHGELLDCGASRAFAVCDHQCAHVYVARETDLGAVRALLTSAEGVGQVLDGDDQAAIDLGHERSGELVCFAERGTWFAYPYWLEEARRPDFATTVDIHRKPGYDPAELFLDPSLAFTKLEIAWTLLKKKLGFRYLMRVVPTDPSLVRGSHGLAPSSPEKGPVWVASAGLELPAEVGSADLFFEA